MSDHRAIKFHLCVYDNERGKGYWKLNTSLLGSNEYKCQVNKIITDISNKEGSSIEKWESLKISIKYFSIAFSIKRQKTYKQLVFQIEQEISEIENSYHKAMDMNRKRELENQLNNLYDKKAQGAQIRSRAKWVSDGEKNSKYFLSLEKKHQTQNVIHEVLSENSLLTEDDDILGAMCDYYENLYSSKLISNEDIDLYCKVNTLSETDKNMCDTFPSMNECKETVMNLKSNKSPGLDGIPNEFYQCFWHQLSSIFYNM